MCQRYGWHAYQSVKACARAVCSNEQARHAQHPPPPHVAGHWAITSLTATPQRRGLITTGGKSGSLTFNLYLFIQEAYRPNFGCHILVKSQFFREKYRKSMLLEQRSWTLRVQMYFLAISCFLVTTDKETSSRCQHRSIRIVSKIEWFEYTPQCRQRILPDWPAKWPLMDWW